MKLHTYEGKPCKACNATLRYVASRRCVACKQRLNSAAWNREAVLKRHEVTA